MLAQVLYLFLTVSGLSDASISTGPPQPVLCKPAAMYCIDCLMLVTSSPNSLTCFASVKVGQLQQHVTGGDISPVHFPQGCRCTAAESTQQCRCCRLPLASQVLPVQPLLQQIKREIKVPARFNMMCGRCAGWRRCAMTRRLLRSCRPPWKLSAPTCRAARTMRTSYLPRLQVCSLYPYFIGIVSSCNGASYSAAVQGQCRPALHQCCKCALCLNVR